MDTSIRTSFIPKTSLSRPPSARGEGMGFFSFLCIAVLIVSLLGWLAAYTYNSLVKKDVHSLEASLTKAKESFDPGLLKIFENLDRRLSVANNLLNEHTSVSPFFVLLDQITLKSVRFTSFNYVNSPTASAVRMAGIATDFPAVALQAYEFSKQNNNILNPIFGGLGVGIDGRVKFDVSMNLSPSLIRYAPRTDSILGNL